MVMQESEKTWSMNIWVTYWVFRAGTLENIFESQVEVTYWTVNFELFSAIFIVINKGVGLHFQRNVHDVVVHTQ